MKTNIFDENYIVKCDKLVIGDSTYKIGEKLTPNDIKIVDSCKIEANLIGSGMVSHRVGNVKFEASNALGGYLEDFLKKRI